MIIFQPDELVDNCGADLPTVRDVLTTFLEETPAAVGRIADAAAAGRADLLCRESHALKGSSLVVGAAALGEAARRLESSARQAAADLPELTAVLAGEWQRARAALEEFRAALPEV